MRSHTRGCSGRLRLHSGGDVDCYCHMASKVPVVGWVAADVKKKEKTMKT